MNQVVDEQLMKSDQAQDEAMPVVTDLSNFDKNSGNYLERLIFNYRFLVLLASVLITGLLGWQASRLVMNASYEEQIPVAHPYIKNYLENRESLRGLGNLLRVSVVAKQGDIFDAQYLDVLKSVNDELFLTPGVDRAWVKSLWSPAVRWSQVTEKGSEGGPVMPSDFDGSADAMTGLRENIDRAGITGTLVSRDLRSSVVEVPLLEIDPTTGNKLDYGTLSQAIEKNVREKYAGPGSNVEIKVIGFAKVMGDLIEGVTQVMLYFGYAVLIAACLIYWHTRCVRSTVLLLACSVIAVVWQLGIVVMLGFDLDPYSVLVPFLVFAIGVSHGAQKMNGISRDVALGTHQLVAARYTFRRLFLAGLMALLADSVAFAVLLLIDIPVIQHLALIASVGVAVLIFTNLILLPVLLSYVGVARRPLPQGGDKVSLITKTLLKFTERKWATSALAVAALITVIAFVVSLNLRVGDIAPGAPELRPDSRYNLDVKFFSENYGMSADQFAVMVKTEPWQCEKFETLIEADRLSWTLQQLPVVQSAVSLADPVRRVTSGSSEGNPKWLTVSRNQDMTNFGTRSAAVSNPELINQDCDLTPVIAYLTDHKAQTLQTVLKTVEDFAAQHDTETRKFLPVAGGAGIEAVTNIVVKEANRNMLFYVYASVVVLCYLTFRSWRAVVVAVIPLVVTSVLCEALMVGLGIGMKVATLPVVALGVGIGVDYALYLLSIQLVHQRAGDDLRTAYQTALTFTGKVVALVGITLAAGVITWALSPIQFQADMGILLSFMFIWNMVCALILIPALSHFLLTKRHVASISGHSVMAHASAS